jgi:predicted SAM-dependent methyltransferase
MSKNKLHLGCGECYFDGYTNIDYPLTEHNVQKTSVADLQANLLEITYASSSIDEIRLHHVFEHFSRAVAAAQLCRWNHWLKVDGELRIEVPDFERTAKAALGSLFSRSTNQYVALRHIFGSQEAHWAVHYHGYSEHTLKELLINFGFRPILTRRNNWKGTYNIDISATKIKAFETKDECNEATRGYLNRFLVDQSESELRLLDCWMEEFDKNLII